MLILTYTTKLGVTLEFIKAIRQLSTRAEALKIKSDQRLLLDTVMPEEGTYTVSASEFTLELAKWDMASVVAEWQSMTEDDLWRVLRCSDKKMPGAASYRDLALEYNDWVKPGWENDMDVNVERKVPLKPMHHQLVGSIKLVGDFIHAKSGVLCTDGVGLGKTAMIINTVLYIIGVTQEYMDRQPPSWPEGLGEFFLPQ